ncbi:family 2A encapsulin nanocompartment cargo protein cysteine desulfurase [Pedobacter sp. UBA5917]|uniref:family 2A encapsulin nanocompartment cargo protein cysteine desulfurase n=1 Tax=Pedobacter sp. UBA5917 TaxID=1947061 RepID=UPI0025D87798|nr:family 2A encapsulin nanocompartment cargo protein cysteine desulfurase [Pedobacter sp. UBA5917]
MSINTHNNHNLPDQAALEQLANALFSALPGSKNAIPDVATQQERHHNDFNMEDPQTSFPDPHFEPKTKASVPSSGFGASPTAAESLQAQKIADEKLYLPKEPVNADGIVPSSVSGSGKSPSYLEHKNEFDLKKPQTSLNDPHFNSIEQHKTKDFGDGNPFARQFASSIEPSALFSSNHDEALIKALTEITQIGAIQQLPFTSAPDLSASDYYFLANRRESFPNHDFSSAHQKGSGDLFTHAALSKPLLNVDLIKKDFPILQETVNGKPLIWLDNAATTQKPKQVIDRITYFYEHENSNIHRAAHELAARATDAYEDAREKVRSFINAASTNEVIFVRGTTEGINLVAKSWGEQNLNFGDEIIISHLEHHANIVPWQQLAAKKGLKLKVIPVDDQGQILLDEYVKLITPKTRLVSFTQVSNALGTVTPAKQIIDLAHAAGAKVLVDGAQSVSHIRTDVTALNCDWFVFSGHKVFGPTGIGVVYGKEDLLNQTAPWQGGGNMIKDVTFEHTQYHDAPSRFEAGTGNIADAVGLGAAIDYVNKIGIDIIHQYEHYLLLYATRLLNEIPGLKLIGTANEKASVLSFIFEGYTNDEVGQALNKQGIAVRTGHHCAQPILRRFGLESTVRPSLAFYNTCADVDVLVETLYRLRSGYK